jgi:hypothetical protein
LLKIFLMESYTFIDHPVEKLHQIIPGILPGIEKIVTVYYDETKGQIVGRLSEKKGQQYVARNLIVDKILPTMQRFMEEKNPYDWYNSQTLPFDIEVKPLNPSITIFSELQNIVLLIRITNSGHEFNDLVFLYLNENPSNFGVTNSRNPMTTDNKSIIAFVLNNTIRTFVNLQKNDKQTLKSYNQRTRQIIGQTESIKSEMQRTKENYGISLVKLCQQIIKEHSAKNGKTYNLSVGALDKIKNYKGEIKDLEAIISETLAYADSLHVDYSDDIQILEWHIVFDIPVKRESERSEVRKSDDQFAKTLSLLDKLENAALVAKSKQLKLTGTNVGNSFLQPITAPAISDALYNHKTKINDLLKMYPDKWETIRTDFKPLKNILITEKG